MVNRVTRDTRKREAAGKFNVCIILHEEDDTEEEIYSKTWIHQGPFLILDLFDSTLRVINLGKYKGFRVTGIESEKLLELQDRN